MKQGDKFNMMAPLGRACYAICIMALGVQQLAYGKISVAFLPSAFSDYAVIRWLTYPWCLAFILSGAGLLTRYASVIALVSGWVLFGLFLFVQVPYLTFMDPNGGTLLYWAPAMQNLAMAGCSFIVASDQLESGRWQKMAMRLGPVFFSVMLFDFGLSHFLYDDFVSRLVPGWIPYPMMWTYLTGVALMGAATAIVFRIRIMEVALLLGLMIFSWLLLIHIPRAMADPYMMHGLELTRVFMTIGYTGIAMILSSRGVSR